MNWKKRIGGIGHVFSGVSKIDPYRAKTKQVQIYRSKGVKDGQFLIGEAWVDIEELNDEERKEFEQVEKWFNEEMENSVLGQAFQDKEITTEMIQLHNELLKKERDLSI